MYNVIHSKFRPLFIFPPSLPVSSGGHLNPAVTLGVLMAGGVNVLAALCYFTAQLVGGIAGAACILVSISHCLHTYSYIHSTHSPLECTVSLYHCVLQWRI